MSTAIELPGLSETQRQIVELAREFARTKIEPFAAEWDRRAHLPPRGVDEVGRPRFLRLWAPPGGGRVGVGGGSYLLPPAEVAAPAASGAAAPPLPHPH